MNKSDEYLQLRAAFAAGCRIQAWTLNHEGERTSANGDWRVVHEPQFSCPAHLYRIHPEDLHLLPTEPAPDREDAERLDRWSEIACEGTDSDWQMEQSHIRRWFATRQERA